MDKTIFIDMHCVLPEGNFLPDTPELNSYMEETGPHCLLLEKILEAVEQSGTGTMERYWENWGGDCDYRIEVDLVGSDEAALKEVVLNVIKQNDFGIKKITVQTEEELEAAPNSENALSAEELKEALERIRNRRAALEHEC